MTQKVDDTSFGKLSISGRDVSEYKQEIYGICALWVMIFHCYLVGIGYSGDNWLWRIIGAMIKRGNMCVDIFLLLSGVYLHFAYCGHEGDLSRFTKRRVVRLVIPAALIWGPWWFYLAVQAKDLYTFFLRVLTLDFWVTGKQDVWYVSFLLLCYVLYPYIYTFLKTTPAKRNLRAFVLIFLTMALVYMMWKVKPSFYKTYGIAITRMPMFLIGCWLGKYVKEERKLPSWVVPVAYVVFVVAMGLLAVFGMPKGIWNRYVYIPCGISALLVFLHLLKCISWKPLHKLLAFFGNQSLECYLAHLMLINVYKNMPFYEPKNIIVYLLVLVVATGIAFVAARLSNRIQKKLF